MTRWISSTTWLALRPVRSMAEQVLFVPECNVDTALALALVSYRYTFVSHRQGIGQVARVLVAQQQAAVAGRRIIGIVDNDKKFQQAPELAGFTTVVLGGLESHDPHCIRQHPERPNQYLIVLNPACDSWLFRAAQQASLSLPALGLPADLPSFIDFCKQRDVEENSAMRNLLWAIQQARPSAYRELADFVGAMMNVAPPRWP